MAEERLVRQSRNALLAFKGIKRFGTVLQEAATRRCAEPHLYRTIRHRLQTNISVCSRKLREVLPGTTGQNIPFRGPWTTGQHSPDAQTSTATAQIQNTSGTSERSCGSSRRYPLSLLARCGRQRCPKEPTGCGTEVFHTVRTLAGSALV